MSQILNIFRKDTRRFWPEILLSVVIAFAFACAFPNRWRIFPEQSVSNRMQIIVVALGFLMEAGWWLLIARVVHAETLVGDRQFWITRPYEWKKLLAAKVLFAAVWIGVPFLLVQSLILVEAGYSPCGYAPVLLLNLFLMSTVFLLPLFSVATVTQNFARLTLTLLACLVLFVGYVFVTNGLPQSYTPANPYPNRLLVPLLFCGCVLAIALEYATRRVWVSRTLLIVLPLLLALTEATNHRQSLVDRAYPQPSAGSAAPVSIAAIPSKDRPVEARTYNGRDFIDFPIRYSGVAEGYAIVTEDLKFTLTAADGSQWTSPWQQTHDHIGPRGHGSELSLQISPALYDRFKSGPVTVNITFAINRYQADSVATMPFPTRDQAVPGIGICSADGFMDGLLCRSTRDPRLTYVAVLWSKAPCSGPPAASAATKPGDGWYEPEDRNFGLTSVWVSRLFLSGAFEDDGGDRYARWQVCPGSPLTVTQYHLVDRTQTSFTLTNFALPAEVRPT
ncbi:MAG: hypothetical protein ABSG84_06550 [Acidobacteriaceae bacterium]|jgi:hypothetical protein